MFEKLNEIVKESEQIFLASELSKNALNDAMHEATGVIVDVLKAQLDRGKANDLMSYFTGEESNYQNLTDAMVNKYANRLNSYFNLNIKAAKTLSEQVMPIIMSKFIHQTIASKKEENGVFSLLNWLSGNTVNFENFFLKLNVVQVA
ncbi:hypothetical protein [Pedobacter arcticus]|uniref:hypothetical protein n=1 Tax=Pedobacter arcticus TaxID=752140 RepID=UPI00031DA6DA|nr:hypothetical protein [Pedobacter arcticus]